MLEPPGREGAGKSSSGGEKRDSREIFTPSCPFSQAQFKLNPAMRNNLSPGSDPLNAWRMNSSLASPQNYSRAHKTLAGLWNPTSRLTGIWQMALMILPNGSSHFWHQARAFSTRQSLGCDVITQLSKLLFDLWQKTGPHTLERAAGTMGEHQVDSSN